MEQASSSILLSPPPSAPSDAPSDDEEDLEDMDMHIEMEEESVADKSKDEGTAQTITATKTLHSESVYFFRSAVM